MVRMAQAAICRGSELELDLSARICMYFVRLDGQRSTEVKLEPATNFREVSLLGVTP